MSPGPTCDSRSIEQREFDYTRHGTVNMLVFLGVRDGLIELVPLEKIDGERYLPELELLRRHTPPDFSAGFRAGNTRMRVAG